MNSNIINTNIESKCNKFLLTKKKFILLEFQNRSKKIMNLSMIIISIHSNKIIQRKDII